MRLLEKYHSVKQKYLFVLVFCQSAKIKQMTANELCVKHKKEPIGFA